MGFVQVATGGSTAAASSVSATFGSAITSGNVVWGIIAYDNGAGGTATVTVNGVTANLKDNVLDTAANQRSQSFILGNNSGGTVVTVSFTTSPTFIQITAVEESGCLKVADPTDVHTAQFITNNPGTTDGLTSGSATTTVANDIVVGMCTDANSIASALAGGTGFTFRNNNNIANYCCAVEDGKVQASTGSVAATFTLTSNTDPFVVLMIAIKPASLVQPLALPPSVQHWFGDDPPVWQGRPAPSNRTIILTTTQQKLYGQPGQSPPHPAYPKTLDDPPVWSGRPAPTNMPIILTTTQIKMFGQPGQDMPSPAYPKTLDDPPVWSGTPLSPSRALLSLIPKPFVQGTRHFEYDDPPVWSGAPRGSQLIIPLLTAAGQAGPYDGRFFYQLLDDPPVWVGGPGTINLSLQSLTVQKPLVQPSPTFDYDDPPVWTGEPSAAYATLFTQNVIFVPAQFIPNPGDTIEDRWLWRPKFNQSLLSSLSVAQKPLVQPPPTFDYDDPPVWSGQPSPNAFVTLTSFGLFPVHSAVPSPLEFETVWTGAPRGPGILGLLSLPALPFVQRTRHFDYDDPGVWQWRGNRFNYATTSLLLPTPFVQKTRHFDYDDPAVWVGAPQGPERGLLNTLTPPSPFFVENTRQFNYDDPPVWTGEPSAAYATLFTQNVIFVPAQFIPNPGDTIEDRWLWRPKFNQSLLSSLSVAQKPLVQPPPTFDYDDPPVWSGQPSPNAFVTLTSFGLYVPHVMEPSPLEFETVWTGAPRGPGIGLLSVSVAPSPFFVKSTRQFHYDDPPTWQWRGNVFNYATISSLIPKPFVQGTRHFEYDDPPVWAGAPRGPEIGLLNTLTPPSPFFVQNTRQFHYDDAPVWQWRGNRFNYATASLIIPASFVQEMRHFEVDDPPVWTGGPRSGSPQLLLLATSAPFQPTSWRFYPDDAGVWYPGPKTNLVLAGQQPLVTRPPQFVYDDPAIWVGRSRRNTTLFLPPLSPLVVRPPQFVYDDPPVWLARAPNRNLVLMLTALAPPPPTPPTSLMKLSLFWGDDPPPIYIRSRPPPAALFYRTLLFDPRFWGRPSLTRNFVAKVNRTFAALPVLTRSFVTRTSLLPQAPDFTPIDTTEVVNGTFDFGLWLPNAGQTVASIVSVACSVAATSAVQDPLASTRIVGPATIGVSPFTGLPNQAVLQQFGNMVAGVLYLLQATVMTSDNQRFVLWVHQQCNAPS